MTLNWLRRWRRRDSLARFEADWSHNIRSVVS